MAKRYIAKIEYTIYPDENGLLESDYDMYDDDLEDRHRTPDELIAMVREDMFEIITNGVKYNDLWNMIDVEVVDA